MGYQSVTVENFGGLNYADDPYSLGLDQLALGINADVTVPGRLAPRSGFVPAGGISGIDVIRKFGQYVVASAQRDAGTVANNGSYRLDTTTLPGGLADILDNGALDDRSDDFAVCGVNGYVWACSASRTLRRATLAAGSPTLGSNIASTPQCELLATTPISDRLVAARIVGASSKVQFSAAGDGDTWGSTDYVNLAPGDTESITGLAVFDNRLFVFKRTKFWVLESESTDASGGVLFNFRPVNFGKGVAYPKGCVATKDGVYFVAADGVYLTTGGAPVCVSDAIRPVFRPSATVHDQQSGMFDPKNYSAIGTHDGCIYVTGAVSAFAWVLNPATGAWSRWSAPWTSRFFTGDCLSAVSSTTSTSLLLAGLDGLTNPMMSQVGTETTDNGTSINLKVGSGWTDFGVPGPKRVRQARFRGRGSFNWALGVDHLDPAATAAVTLTPVTTTSGVTSVQGWDRTAYRGDLVNWYLQSTDSSLVLDEIVLDVADRRAAGESN